MTRIYCECGTELTILDTISDDLYSLKHIVEPCPNCTDDWRSVKDDPPQYEEPVLVCWDGLYFTRQSYRFKNYKGEDYWSNGDTMILHKTPDWWKPMPKAKGVE